LSAPSADIGVLARFDHSSFKLLGSELVVFGVVLIEVSP
jgi:hypothetical protein